MTKIPASSIRSLRELTGAGIMECRTALVACGGDIESAAGHLENLVREAADHRSDRETKEGQVFFAVGEFGTAAVTLVCETDFAAANALFVETGKQCLDELKKDFCDHETLLARTEQHILRTKAVIKEHMKLKSSASLILRRGEDLAWYIHTGNRILAAFAYTAPPEQVGSNPEFRQLLNDITLQIAAGSARFVDRSAIPVSVIRDIEDRLSAEVAGLDKPAALKEKILKGKIEKELSALCLVEQPFIKDTGRTVGDLLAASAGTLEITRILYQSVL